METKYLDVHIIYSDKDKKYLPKLLQQYKKFKIENWKVSNGILNQKKKWDQSLSNEYINLSNRINEISINQIDKTRVDLISDIIMFNENYSSVFCVKKRKYAMLLFTNLIEQLQKKLSILK